MVGPSLRAFVIWDGGHSPPYERQDLCTAKPQDLVFLARKTGRRQEDRAEKNEKRRKNGARLRPCPASFLFSFAFFRFFRLMRVWLRPKAALCPRCPLWQESPGKSAGNDHVCATVEKVKHPAGEKFFIPSGKRSYAIFWPRARTEFRHDSCNTAHRVEGRSGPRRTPLIYD